MGLPKCPDAESLTPPGPCPESPSHPLQGFSAHWWNFRHFQHHAKPNIFHKDPDVTVAPVFLLGESSVEVCGENMDSTQLGLKLQGDLPGWATAPGGPWPLSPSLWPRPGP